VDDAARRARETELREVQTVDSWEDLPAFPSEDEEDRFWATHGLGETLLDQMRPIGDDEDLPAARQRDVVVHLDADTVRRLRALADARHESYEQLINDFLVERLYEEEKRAGLVG
jgi:hypothetical protein